MNQHDKILDLARKHKEAPFVRDQRAFGARYYTNWGLV